MFNYRPLNYKLLKKTTNYENYFKNIYFFY